MTSPPYLRGQSARPPGLRSPVGRLSPVPNDQGGVAGREAVVSRSSTHSVDLGPGPTPLPRSSETPGTPTLVVLDRDEGYGASRENVGSDRDLSDSIPEGSGRVIR